MNNKIQNLTGASSLIWVDCEMRGLDHNKDILLEVALFITDAYLNIIKDPISITIKPDKNININDLLSEYVKQMHRESGLLNDIPKGYSLEVAEKMLIEYVLKNSNFSVKMPLCGNTVSCDRLFLTTYMPNLMQLQNIHYRNVDISSIKELVKRWYPDKYYNLSQMNKNAIIKHRALPDLYYSLSELRYYMEHIFIN